jgi:hypothetical protein
MAAIAGDRSSKAHVSSNAVSTVVATWLHQQHSSNRCNKEKKELVAENLALKQQIQQISELLEHDLKCSISCEVFRDPVILRDGHTYERVDIEQWFDMGNTTSPLTNQVINRPLFVPNRIVKNMVSALALN